MKLEDILTVKIDSLAAGGDAVARHEGFAIFVENGVPGDKAKIQLIEVKKNYGRARIAEVIEPSPDRVEPRCPIANVCGGCQWQHIRYETQLRQKQQQVQDALERIAEIPTANLKIQPIIGMEDPWFYRNKVQLPAGQQNGQLTLGFFERKSHRVVDMAQCYTQHPLLTEVALITKKILQKHNIPPYNEATGKGIIRHLILRMGFTTGEILLGLVVNGESLPYSYQIVDEISDEVKKLKGTDPVPKLVGIVQNINTQRNNVILGKKTTLLFGQDHIIDQLDRFRFKVSINSFFQVNPQQMIKLYNQVGELALFEEADLAVDAYAGIGSIAIWVADRLRRIYGIEEVLEAVEDGMHNCGMNKIRNCEFRAGRVEETLPKIMGKLLKPSVILLDPPRHGCSPEALKAVIEAGPKTIMYVSCDPATLARDIKVLVAEGYRIEVAQPVDMFPHTHHVEVVAKLILKSKEKRR